MKEQILQAYDKCHRINKKNIALEITKLSLSLNIYNRIIFNGKQLIFYHSYLNYGTFFQYI